MCACQTEIAGDSQCARHAKGPFPCKLRHTIYSYALCILQGGHLCRFAVAALPGGGLLCAGGTGEGSLALRDVEVSAVPPRMPTV